MYCCKTVRRAAVDALAALGASEHAEEALRLLFDAKSCVCAAAARGLVAFGAQGAKALMDRRRSERCAKSV